MMMAVRRRTRNSKGAYSYITSFYLVRLTPKYMRHRRTAVIFIKIALFQSLSMYGLFIPINKANRPKIERTTLTPTYPGPISTSKKAVDTRSMH